MLKLKYLNFYIGEVTGFSSGKICNTGTIRLTCSDEAITRYLLYLTDEAHSLLENPPFPEEYSDDENWSLETEEGTRLRILVPAVHADGVIYWVFIRNQSESPSD